MRISQIDVGAATYLKQAMFFPGRVLTTSATRQ